jgi:hypothetical protein
MNQATTRQLTLDLQPPRIIWQVQVSRSPTTKSAYKNRVTTDKASQAILYYHGINVGYGYKKRLIKIEGKKRLVVAKQYS